MTGKIFINYRRDEDWAAAGWLFELLQSKFSNDRLFMDVDSIAPGRDFVRELDAQVAQCDVLLAVIGRSWLTMHDDLARRRLDSADDFVRIEIEAALRQNKTIIPVLLHDARMPKAEALPEPLKPLARRQAVQLTHGRFRADVQSLIRSIEDALGDVEKQRQATAQMVEEQRRADEVAEDWGSAFQKEVETELEALAWQEISRNPSIAALDGFLTKFPDSAYGKVAGILRARLQKEEDDWGTEFQKEVETELEALAWQEISRSPSIDALDSFLATFPDSEHGKAADILRAKLHKQAEIERETLVWREINDNPSISTLDGFLEAFPHSAHVQAAEAMRDRMRSELEARREALAWWQLGKNPSLSAAEDFLGDFLAGEYDATVGDLRWEAGTQGTFKQSWHGAWSEEAGILSPRKKGE